MGDSFLVFRYCCSFLLHQWKDRLQSQCHERQRSFSYFISFSMNTLQVMSAFGSVSQLRQQAGVPPPTQRDWAKFNTFAPSQGWFDQLIYTPHVKAADRAKWEAGVGYPITTFALNASLPDTIPIIDRIIFPPYPEGVVNEYCTC
jgi:hypothetical protein